MPKKHNRTTRDRKKYIRGKGPRASLALSELCDNDTIGNTTNAGEDSIGMSRQGTPEMEYDDHTARSPAWGPPGGRVIASPCYVPYGG